MSHTPGPWKWVGDIGASHLHGPGDEFDHVLFYADYENLSLWGHNATDNARLIAAAPDLLAALRGLIAEIGVTAVFQDHPAFNAARAAIAKATGADK